LVATATATPRSSLARLMRPTDPEYLQDRECCATTHGLTGPDCRRDYHNDDQDRYANGAKQDPFIDKKQTRQ
jgi:hypothetical protein